MGKRNNANYNGRLTSYAAGQSSVAIENDLSDWIFPRVPTGVSNGQFKRYSGKNAMQVYETLRAIGGNATRIKFESDDPFFNCKPNALEVPIDDSERDAAGDIDGAQSALEESKVKTLVSNAKISRAVRIQGIIDGLTPISGKGVWSADESDPILELNQEIERITTVTGGHVPNRLAIGLSVWMRLCSHPAVLARLGDTTVKSVTQAQFTAMLAFPVQVKVGTISRDKKKFGVGKDAEQVFGAKVLLFLGNDNPTVYDPSFGKTFSTKKGGVDQVWSYRENGARSDIYAVDWSEDTQVVYAECASLIAYS